MNAIPSANLRRSKTVAHTWRAALLVLLSSAAGSQLSAQETVSAQEPAPAGPQTAATLKLQEINFWYRSAVRLSCDAIRSRVAAVLLTLGARQDLDVRVNDCDAFDSIRERAEDQWWANADRAGWQPRTTRVMRPEPRPDQTALVNVRAMMPVEATPEVLAEIKKEKSRRELVSRVNGSAAAVLDDPGVFPARRQRVTLSQRTVGLEPEECELLEQMSRVLFDKLDVRVVRRGPACDRGMASRLSPEATVEALVPVMPATPRLAPAAGESTPEPGAPAAQPE